MASEIKATVTSWGWQVVYVSHYLPRVFSRNPSWLFGISEPSTYEPWKNQSIFQTPKTHPTPTFTHLDHGRENHRTYTYENHLSARIDPEVLHVTSEDLVILWKGSMRICSINNFFVIEIIIYIHLYLINDSFITIWPTLRWNLGWFQQTWYTFPTKVAAARALEEECALTVREAQRWKVPWTNGVCGKDYLDVPLEVSK